MNTMNTNGDLIEMYQQPGDNFFKLFAALWSRKYWILSTALIFGALGFLAAMTEAPQYRAEAVVQLETKSSGVQLSTDIAEMLTPDSEAITQIEILKSSLVLSEVVKSLSLDIVAVPDQLPVFGNLISRLDLPRPDWVWLTGFGWNNESIMVAQMKMPATLNNRVLRVVKNIGDTFTLTMPDGSEHDGVIGLPLTVGGDGFSITLAELIGSVGSQYTLRRSSIHNAIKKIRAGLQVYENPNNSGIVRIAMVSESAIQSERVVAAIVKAYVDQNVGRSAEEAERSLKFLAQQIPIIQNQLRDAETALNTYRLESESIDLNYEAQSILERTVSLDAQLSALSLEETELSRRYTQNHPSYLALLDKKQRIEAEKLSISDTVRSLPGTQQEILRKTRDVDVSQQIYLQLLNKSQELRVMKAGAIGNVRLIDEAVSSPNPVGPDVPLIASVWAMLGGMMAAGVILLRYFMYKEIDTPDDLSKLNIPALAIVPLSEQQQKLDRRREVTLLAHHKPKDVAIETVRALRTSLYAGMCDEDRNIIAVSGPSPTVGKSFISSNLAYLTAKTGARVIVIDADLRRGNLGKYFGVPQDLPGFSQMLEGSRLAATVMYQIDLENMQIVNSSPRFKPAMQVVTHDLGDTLDDSYTDSSVRSKLKPASRISSNVNSELPASITVVPRGQTVDNPSELLMHQRLPEFMEFASHHFDVVIIDTPPVLAATDAMIIGKYADINIMVVRHGDTTVHEAEEVSRTYNNNRIRLNGIVLNGYDSHRGKYGKYGTQYGYRYDYS